MALGYTGTTNIIKHPDVIGARFKQFTLRISHCIIPKKYRTDITLLKNTIMGNA